MVRNFDTVSVVCDPEVDFLAAIKLTQRRRRLSLYHLEVGSSSKVPVPSINILKFAEKGIYHLVLWRISLAAGSF